MKALGFVALLIAAVSFAQIGAVATESENGKTEGHDGPHGGGKGQREISACKYLLVSDFTSDPYGIAKELRSQARLKGFEVVSAIAEVPLSERLKACAMLGSWNREAFGGEVSVRVQDVVSKALVGEAAASGTAWWSADRTVRGIVSKLYTQLGYSGFDEAAYEERIHRLYPDRPKVKIIESEITSVTTPDQLQGIWTDPQNEYRLGIVKAPIRVQADYVAVVLHSENPVWHEEEIKAEIRSTASPAIFTCTCYLGDKQPSGTTLSLEANSVLKGTVGTKDGTTVELTLLRVWPKAESALTETSSAAAKTGTGFLLNRAGLIATNWHVVSGAARITVAFPGWSTDIPAAIVVRDKSNDLAILRLSETSKLRDSCPELPFQLSTARSINLGQTVSTIGYPLASLLGTNPKFSEGVVSSKSGMGDDPRSFQISAPVQPGSSGSPLFDSDGDIIGIVVATLDAGKTYEATSAIPQNVNWAIKSDYLLQLLSMIPNEIGEQRTTPFTPEKAAACVAMISSR